MPRIWDFADNGINPPLSQPPVAQLITLCRSHFPTANFESVHLLLAESTRLCYSPDPMAAEVVRGMCQFEAVGPDIVILLKVSRCSLLASYRLAHGEFLHESAEAPRGVDGD